MATTQAASTIIRLSNFYAKLLKQQDQWLAAHGISYKEFLIMHYLRDAQAKHLKRIELAEKVGLSASGVTRLLNPMEKIGLIAKEEGARDARVSLVRLTESGEALFRDAENSFNQRAKSFVNNLDVSQRSSLKVLSEVRI